MKTKRMIENLLKAISQAKQIDSDIIMIQNENSANQDAKQNSKESISIVGIAKTK